MIKQLVVYFFLVFCLNISAQTFRKDTIFYKIDTHNNLTFTIHIKEKYGYYTDEPNPNGRSGTILTPLSLKNGIHVKKITKKTIVVYENKKVIFKSYCKTWRLYDTHYSQFVNYSFNNYNYLSETWIENQPKVSYDYTYIQKHKMTKWNNDTTKETLLNHNNSWQRGPDKPVNTDYKHIVYDLKGKKIKEDKINKDKINWNDWSFEKE